MALDVGALIEAVSRRPTVWDRRNKFYANRVAVDKCWIEISEEMGRDEIQLKKKWKYLRDQFASEWARIISTRQGPGDPLEGHLPRKWQFFHQLMFLKDVMKPRAAPTMFKNVSTDTSAPSLGESSLAESADNNNSNVNDEHEALNISDVVSLSREEEDAYRSDASMISNGQRKRKRQRSTIDLDESESHKGLLQLEEKMLEYLIHKSQAQQAVEEDYDLLFLKSLLPYVKKIPDNKKLRFRSRVMEILEEFVYPREDVAPPTPPIIIKAEPP